MVEEEEGSASEGTDSERCSGSIASFLANEKLMSLDSMNSDMTGWLIKKKKYMFQKNKF